ncbi:MAG: Gfo/Idh/MocA family oxidoreductase [Thermoproteales archaeon]|nr:Gfo/Idh/MocA family oxidoreductase [Thermoproteales archaeon]
MEVRVGFIGCGGIAKAHAERLARIEGVRLAAFCDVKFSRAEEFARRYGGAAYRDHREMLGREELDACYICIPPYAHTDQELLCAERGVHFFVEKPVALTLEKALEVLKAVRKAGVITQVGYVLRFVDSLRRARELVQAEGGRIGLFEAWRYGIVVGGPEHWWRRRELSGGQLVEQSTHQVDLARWVVGSDVREVYAAFEEKLLEDLPRFNIESASIVCMRFKSGAIGVVTSTCAAQPAGCDAGFRLIARHIQLVCRGRRCTIIRGDEVETLEASVDPYMEEDRHFIECVKRGRDTEVPYVEGVKTLEVTLAAVKSARERRVIKLPLTSY